MGSWFRVCALVVSGAAFVAVTAVGGAQNIPRITPAPRTGVSTGYDIAPGAAGEVADAPAQTPVPGQVPPTVDGYGGATTYTKSMPLDQGGLINLRRNFMNRPEFRAAWVTRFEWVVRGNGQATKGKMLEWLDAAKAANLNAIIFQLRADGTTLYPSALEPWSHMMGGDPGFDPAQFVIDEAHKRGLEFHAYINACPVSEQREPTSDPRHIWNKHCQPGSNPNWLVYQDGKPVEYNEYWWMNPNLPEVQTYLRYVLIDFAKRYKVDGIHFDRIRFPSAQVSDDPWSKARFQGDGNPDKLGYNEWQRDNITRMLNDIYGVVNAINPKIKFSASVWGIYDKTKLPQGNDKARGYSWTSSGVQNYHQDAVAWINHGCMDALVPMAYWDMGGNKPDYDEVMLQYVHETKNGRHIYGGLRVHDNPVEMLREVVATNMIGAHGVVPFTMKRVVEKNQVKLFHDVIYANPVPVPAMPWKENPTTGMVMVVVKNAQKQGVVDAHVKIGGRDYTWLSSADGFTAILDVPPGQHQITATKTGMGTGMRVVNVEVGKSTVAEIELK